MNRPQTSEADAIVQGTARIGMAYVAGNRLPPNAVAALITTVSRALRSAPDGAIDPAVPDRPSLASGLTFAASDYPREQAAPRRLTFKEIAASIHEKFLICFEDGQRYLMLSRHLRLFALTPDAYRAKWGLPDDYPMLRAFDLKHRAELARQRKLWHYDRSKAKPRGHYVAEAKASAQGNAAPIKPKASSTDHSRGGWRRQGGMAQAASPG